MDTTPPAGVRQFVPIGDIAKMLGVTPRTIHRWIADGLPCHQPAGKFGTRLFDPAEVEAWVKSRCSRPTPGQSTDLDDVDGDAA